MHVVLHLDEGWDTYCTWELMDDMYCELTESLIIGIES